MTRLEDCPTNKMPWDGIRLSLTARVGLRGGRVRVRFGIRAGAAGGDYFLTSHSISYTTTVIICECYSKGCLGSGERTFITSEIGQ